ncbi:MAG: protease inhibitor I42 family protein [Anaerolineales bacterium]
MLRKFLCISTLGLMTILATGCGSAKPVNLTAADKGSQVSLKVGGQIVITLDSNPSTGYSWEAQGLDKTIFKQVGEATFISSDPGLVGAGGALTITFNVLKAGTAPLTLVYHRPWEIGVDPLDTFSVTVTVK